MIDRDMVAYAKANNASTAGLFAGEAISAGICCIAWYCCPVPMRRWACKARVGVEQDFVADE